MPPCVGGKLRVTRSIRARGAPSGRGSCIGLRASFARAQQFRMCHEIAGARRMPMAKPRRLLRGQASLFILRALAGVQQVCDLFRHEPDQTNDDTGAQQQSTHVGETRVQYISI